MRSFEFVEPQSLESAFRFLEGDDPAVRPIGGGTALMLMMKSQLFQPARLVSLRKLGTPFVGARIDQARGEARVGAMTTFAELEHSAEFRRTFPSIAQTMRNLANVRVRNVATVGGNLAHADPHLDLPPLWIALGAKVRIFSPSGERTLAVEDLFLGYYETSLRHDELIAEVEVPINHDWKTFYHKSTLRSAHDWPAIGLAASFRSTAGRIAEARIVVSAATDRPMRLVKAETILRGKVIEDDAFNEAAAAAADEAPIESDSRGGADYKRHLLRTYLVRGLRAAARE